MPFDRASGILLHPTSLPSRGGIGDLGPAAYDFVDWLAAAKQSLWQVLPLSPVGFGNSPYSAISAFAGNPLLISLERLTDRGWLGKKDLAELSDHDGPVEFESVARKKLPLLRRAAENFIQTQAANERYKTFKEWSAWWLEDFVTYEVLRQKHGGSSWCDWPEELRHRDARAMERVKSEMARDLEISRAIQFAFFEQWAALRSYCHGKGVKIIGDVAIFVNYDSVTAWRFPELFELDSDLQPVRVAGVPPDFFSKTGQRWGNPLYRWDVMRSQGYDWWIKRIRWTLTLCDIVRLDHFRGFEAYWAIPAADETAVNGKWVPGPGFDLFVAMRAQLGDLPFIAEDLGTITPEVERLRDGLGLPGMRILQFGFSDRGAHAYLPHRYTVNSVVYTGTHDNDTTRGWWKNGATAQEKAAVNAYLGQAKDGVVWGLIRAALGSVAEICIIPAQDVLELDGDARMNLPSKADGNWAWRLHKGQLTAEVAKKLAEICEVSDRDGVFVAREKAQASAADQQGHGKAGEEFAA